MASKNSAGKADRSDPKRNKSLAIRSVLKRMPDAKAAEVVVAVKKEFGQVVRPNMVYMVKTKENMAVDGRTVKPKSKSGGTPMTSAVLWVQGIKLARQLLKATGGVKNATALLKAIDG